MRCARLLAACGCLIPGLAHAELSLSGAGRITVLGGWRHSWNAAFYDGLRAAGEEPSVSRGGPEGNASFGYSANEYLEVGIDLYVGGESIRLAGRPALQSYTYGGLIGARLQTAFEPGFVPFVGFMVGPSLAYTTGAGLAAHEELNNAYVPTVGLTVRIVDHWAATLDVKYFAGVRGKAGDFGSLDAGGLWAGLGITYVLASDPGDRPLD